MGAKRLPGSSNPTKPLLGLSPQAGLLTQGRAGLQPENTTPREACSAGTAPLPAQPCQEHEGSGCDAKLGHPASYLVLEFEPGTQSGLGC